MLYYSGTKKKNQFFVPVGSILTDLSNHGLKILENQLQPYKTQAEKLPITISKQYDIITLYTVLMLIQALEWSRGHLKCQEEICKTHANTTSFHLQNLSKCLE